ncbi:site-specific DNA-methyltransferase [Streptomyces sp. NBC_00341]|uniref:site-specific DNA-methyltransferase n=1 Tax=Streptomyces sp. NBC_00341 TaxID=2975717 RepID=UPI0030882978|nr:site-specific DNA-methyltransferase [Streptomyces sp. NBC_00341]
MARLDTLIEQISDPNLRAQIQREVAELESRRTFGLVFEKHLPEAIRLRDVPIRLGSTVMFQDREDDSVWQLTALSKGIATLRNDEGNETKAPLADLTTARVFGEPVYPGLLPSETVERGGRKPHHLVINGENHHVLQALRYTHVGKIDCIYVDPPYNTGGDFTYNDKYVGRDDRYRHSKWLSFMEKRLRLARDLLRQTGVIIIAIDDNEQAHLRLLMDQVFSEANFLASATWIGSSKNDARFTSGGLDYMLIYGRSRDALIDSDARWSQTKKGYDLAIETAKQAWEEAADDPVEATRLYRSKVRGKKAEMEKGVARYNEIDETGRLYFRADLSSPNPRPNLMYDLPHPVTGLPVRMPKNGWVYSPTTMTEKLTAGRILFGEDHTTGAYYKRYLDEVEGQSLRPLIDVDRRASSLELARLLGEKRFQFPKDTNVLSEWIGAVTMRDPNAVVLDFFGGSGSTCEAVLGMNAQDDGNRQCLLVTNNEVDSKTAKQLASEGLKPGDPEWEARGIFEYVTKPRIKTVVKGVRDDGSAYSEGVEANVSFLDLTYLDRTSVERGRAFERIAHLLWVQAGARGAVIASECDTFSVPGDANYGVLFDTDHWDGFVAAVRGRTDITHAYIVTDSDAAFNHVERSLPDTVRVTRLYEDYLSSFEINIGGN